VLIDSAVMDRQVVVVGSGVRNSKLALPSTVLPDLPGAEIISGLAS
jgi:prolyl-tRNA editing enzyme YbaK/EbsC (Cys-tRNA(Pro) deacylase)